MPNFFVVFFIQSHFQVRCTCTVCISESSAMRGIYICTLEEQIWWRRRRRRRSVVNLTNAFDKGLCRGYIVRNVRIRITINVK